MTRVRSLLPCVAALATISLDGARLQLDAIAPDAGATIRIAGNGLVPVEIDRAGRTRLSVPILLWPGTADRATLNLGLLTGAGRETCAAGPVGPAVPRITVDPRRYVALADWRPGAATPDRRRRVALLGVMLAASLLLARLAPRRTGPIVLAVGGAWAIGLGVALARRPTLFTRDEGDARWVTSLEARTYAVPIADDTPWVPAVESIAHLRSLAPRIVVDGNGASLELDLAARGELIFVCPPR